jgi:hypothetical protein
VCRFVKGNALCCCWPALWQAEAFKAAFQWRVWVILVVGCAHASKVLGVEGSYLAGSVMTHHLACLGITSV